MGAWGTGPLENDSALDFVDGLKRARKSNRFSKVEKALQAYLAFDDRLKKGENVSVLTDDDITQLLQSRVITLEWYSSVGQPPPFNVLPELATEEAWATHVQGLAKPETDDGSNEAFCATAAGHLILQSAIGEERILAACDRESLRRLAGLAADTVALILENVPFAASWQPDDYQRLRRALEELCARLRAVA